MNNKDFMLRLMKYKRILIQLRTLGLQRVFSNNLGDALGVSASLVRKDLGRIHQHGNKRGGYNIDSMTERLNEYLGGYETRKIILVGSGNLGRAMLNHEGFELEGIRIAAAFDIAPQTQSIKNIPVLPMEHLESFITENAIKVALLAVPASASAEVRDRMFHAGITGILNFSSAELKSPEGCFIHNVNIGLEIENLFFRVNSSTLDKRENRSLYLNEQFCEE